MTARDFCRRLCLMNWKNFKLQIGNPLQLTVIILCPAVFTFIAVLMRFNTPMRLRTDKMYDAIDLTRIWMEMVENLQAARQVADEHNVTRNPFAPQLIIGWAPQNSSLYQEVMEEAQEQLQPMTLTRFDDCDQLREHMVNESLFAGICFNNVEYLEDTPTDDHDDHDEDLVKHVDGETGKVLNYSIYFPSELRQSGGDFTHCNWYTLYTDDPQGTILQRINLPYEGGFVGYVREGFILIQKAVSESFLSTISEKELPEIALRRFPVLGYKEDALGHELDTGLALLLLFGYLFPAQLFVWQIVKEKQSQLHIILINMNIGNLIQFVSWYCTCMICLTISALLIVIVLKMPWDMNDAVLEQTPWYVLLVVLLTYNAAATSFVCMVASFFSNALTAVRVLTVLWVATYLPNVVLWNNLENDVMAIRYIAFFLSNVVLGMVFEGIVDRETIMHTGWESYSYDDSYRPGPITVFTSTWIFLVNALIFCAIGIYMNIWRLGDRSAKRADKDEGKSSTGGDDPDRDWTESVNQQVRGTDVNSTKIYEVEPSNRRFKLKMKKLCKRFGAKDRPALNLFTWNVYENEVTVLMGHNGCGKSTLLKILAGLMEPTHGSVTVSTYNIQTERKAACMELGIALGDHLLLTELTLLDQLRFMCRVKGMHNATEIDGNISYFLQALQIDHLKHKRLRKLMSSELTLVKICCAFVGNSRIVLIDDIYRDLDKQTKARIWALLNEEKSHRTIIVVVNTTALAESIADRMAIMSNGELKCTGTKPFLKNMYGHGFRLVCVKGPNCKMAELYALMNKYMPTLSIESNIGFKVNFVLENKDEDLFPELIDELEENMERLNVLSFRMRDTSMEEIFLRFGCDEDDQMGGTLGWQENPHRLIDKYFEALAAANSHRQHKGCRLWLLHLRAVVYKRWIFGYKHWIVVLLELLTFLIAALCAFSGVFIHGKDYELIPVTYNLSRLEDVNGFAELFSDEENMKDMLAYYTEILHWYDSRTTVLSKRHDEKYALMHNSEFSRNVNLRYTLGATFDSKVVTAWFNVIQLHIAPYALNLVHNAVARHLFDEEAHIDVTLEMLPFQTRINMMPPGNQYFGDSIAISAVFLHSLIFPAFSLFLIRERASCMKKQQLLAGARLWGFWGFSVLYDLIFLVAYAICVVALVACYHQPDYNAVLLILLFIILLMGGTLVILFSYLVSSLCRSPIYGYMLICFVNCLGVIVFGELHRTGFDQPPKWPYIFHQYLIASMILKLFLFYEYNLLCKDPMVEFASTHIFKCGTSPDCCR